MNYYNLEELKQKILLGLDLMQFLDILGVSYAEILEKFDEEITDNYETLVEALGEPPFY